MVRWWMALGLAMIAVVVAGSLLNISQPGAGEEHRQVSSPAGLWRDDVLVGDGAAARDAALVAAGLLAWASALEYAQSLTRYRTLDYRDMAFNAAGVAMALLALLTPPAAGYWPGSTGRSAIAWIRARRRAAPSSGPSRPGIQRARGLDGQHRLQGRLQTPPCG